MSKLVVTKAKSQNSLDFYAKLVADHSSDSIVVTDTKGLIVWCNPAFTKLTGFNADEVIGKTPGSFLQGRDTNRRTSAEIRAALIERRPIRTEILNYTKTGVGYWIDISISPVFDEAGRHTHFMAIERDITERRVFEEKTSGILAEEETRQFERKLLTQTSEWLYAAKSVDELLRVIQRAMPALMPEAGGQLYIYSNSRDTLDLATAWGDTEHEVHIGPEDCWALRRGRPYQYGRNMIEFPCSHTPNADHPYFCLPIVAHGDTIGVLHLEFPSISMADAAAGDYDKTLDQRWEVAMICAEQISLAIANVRLRMELHEQSVRDQLTGLWNRRWFLDVANRDLARCTEAGKPFGLISIDVDHFKRFNDQHGHDAGDAVLTAVGKMMAKTFLEPLTPCRLGGEEFVVICPNLDANACMEIAETFRVAVKQMEIRHAQAALPSVTISQGVAISDEKHPLGLLDQLKLADNALYAAKEAGRNATILHKTDIEPDLWVDDIAAE